MRAFINHFSFEFRTGIRNKSLLLLNYLFPLAFYAMMGLLMAELNPTFLDTMIPAMIVFAALSSMVLGLPSPLVSSREAGIFRSYKINGIPAVSILAIPALTTVVHTLVVAGIISATATRFFGAASPVNWAGFALVVLLTVFTIAGIGVLVGVISSNSHSAVLWSQLIFLPSMMLGGLMIPSSMLPEALSKIGMLLPSTYAMHAFQGLAWKLDVGFNPLWSAIILLASGILSFGLAIYLFSWDRHNTTRRAHPILAFVGWLPYIVGALIS